MRFRNRLALFMVAIIAIVQLITAGAVYEFTRRSLINQGKESLTAASTVFGRQLDDIGNRVSDSVRVLSLDYALRTAIAERDRATVISALRNFGHRVGADRMLLIDLDGTIISDTVPDSARVLHSVPFPEMLERAEDGNATSVVALDGRVYWMVVVPVLAPVPIAFIAAGIPIDDDMLRQLQQLAVFPQSVELAIKGDHGWVVAARGDNPVSLAPQVLGSDRVDEMADLVSTSQGEYVVAAHPLATPAQSAQVAAVLGYSLDAAMSAYTPLRMALGGLLALGLVIAATGALLIARGVSRPVEALAEVAQRIGEGDYTPPPPPARKDEIGELAAAFGSMAAAIGEREERIQHQVRHDEVTGLPNLRMLEEQMVAELAAGPGASALLAFGLGRLPDIVKTVGHEIGDRLMRAAGTRLVNAAEGAMVVRLGDSNFAMWLPGADRARAVDVARAAILRLQRPYQEENIAVDLEAAVGIALRPEHADEVPVLVRYAEVALLAAAQRQDDRLALYDPAANPHRPERLSLMSDLRQALATDELHLAFQPKLYLPNQSIAGAEALVRWQHRERGFIPPDHFIGLAEETGNIRRLTDWALRTGIAQVAAWDAQGLAINAAINLSVRDLADRDLPRRVGELLDAHRLGPERIVLEITESAIMGEPDAAITVLRDLADRGIDLAIDDFGVGQSSFAYLRRLPVRELKIDKAFILKLSESVEDQTIVRSIVELGHRLGYRVTAEGVEDEAALAFLRQAGCDYAQGYFIARALAPDKFDQMLRESRWPAREKVGL